MAEPRSTSHTPALTVAIPFFNPGEFFVPALQSVFAQTFADWELLLLDDGSSDGSLDLALRLDDPRVRVIADGRNRGLSFRLNQAAQLARGPYLFRMDADDIMHPRRLEVQLAVLKSSSPQAVVGTACYSIDHNSDVVGWRPVPERQATGFAARYSFLHPSVAASTTWFRQNPYSGERVYRRAEDAELWCRTSTFTQFKWIAEPLLFYREVGVFSIENYLAGEEAILDLIHRLEQRRGARWWLKTREHAKIFIFRLLAGLHCENLIVRHRYGKLGLDQLTEACSILVQVKQTVLSVR